MEAILRHICAMHGLRSIGVSFNAGFDSIDVYVHWGPVDDGNCVYGAGKTFDEALEKALVDMRNNQANAAEAAYLDHQQSLMESGGPDDSSYRRDMIASGRGHLIGEAQ